MRRLLPLLLALWVPSICSAGGAEIRALIVDGRNNHDWQITTDALRATLEATGEAREYRAGTTIVATGGINGNLDKVRQHWSGAPPELARRCGDLIP